MICPDDNPEETPEARGLRALRAAIAGMRQANQERKFYALENKSGAQVLECELVLFVLDRIEAAAPPPASKPAEEPAALQAQLRETADVLLAVTRERDETRALLAQQAALHEADQRIKQGSIERCIFLRDRTAVLEAERDALREQVQRAETDLAALRVAARAFLDALHEIQQDHRAAYAMAHLDSFMDAHSALIDLLPPRVT